jgi:hypothetical protein
MLPSVLPRHALVISFFTVFGAAAIACSGDTESTIDATDAATAGDAAQADAAQGDAATSDAATSDVGTTDTGTDGAAACNALNLDGVPVAMLTRVKTPAPVATGGVVADGTYHVREALVHGATTSAPVPVLRTRLSAAGNVWQSVTGDPNPSSTKPPKAETVEIVAAGTSFTLTPKCPTAKPAQTYTYSVVQSDAGKTELHYFAGTVEVTEVILEKE